MAITFTSEERQLLKFRLYDQNVNVQDMNDSELPTDIHLVEYEVGETLYVDMVRAYKMVDIFDPYYDKLTPLGGTILSISNGYGKIKPKLFSGAHPIDG